MKIHKPRIAVIGLKGLPAFGGAATVGENIIDRLKDKYDFTVYAVSSHTKLKTADYNGIRQIVLKEIKFKKLNTLIYYINSVIHVLFFETYDLLHIHHSDSAFLLPILRIKYKILVTTHGVHNSGKIDKWKRFKWFFQGQIPFLRFANIVSCVSLKEKEWLKEKHHIDAVYIPNGVDIYKASESQKKYDIFFGAGRIMRDKGPHILLKALKKINFEGSIIIVGDLSQSPIYAEELKNLSSKLNVSFLGLIKIKKKLLSLIARSRFFIYPSMKEAMSIMLLEGASTGTPILCSDIRENRDIFSDNEVLFFKKNDCNDLAEKMIYAINNYSSMLIRANLAKEKILKNHNWSLIAKQYNELYGDLLKKGAL